MPDFLRQLVRKTSMKYRKMSIQAIISITFTAVAVIGITFISLSLVWRFSSEADLQQRSANQRLLSQVNSNLDNYLRQIMQVSDTMYYRVIKNADLSSDNMQQSFNLLYEENRNSLVSIALFDRQSNLIAATPLSSLKEHANPAQQSWFPVALQRVENLHFSNPHVQNLFDDSTHPFRWVVSLSRHVQLTTDGQIHDGVLLLDINFSGIEHICRDVEFEKNGYLYLISNDGEIIYHPNQQLIYANLLKENNLVAAAYPDGTHEEIFETAKRLVTVKTVGYTGWKLVSVVPIESTFQNSRQMILFGISLLCFSAFLMAFLNFRISAYISDPIRQLEHSVRQLESGKEDVEFSQAGSFEVQRLSHAIRSTVSTMRHLADDIIEQEGQKRLLELEILQSQINPHFLYNTLDSVIWMIEAGRHQEAILMVTALARLFRISLSKGNHLIPLSNELEHAKNYMTIQSIRYKNKFTFQIDADPSLNYLYTLKLIIQPLLENAIYHGLSETDEESIISIATYQKENELFIDVKDTGFGMTQEFAQSLLDNVTPTTQTKGSGMGLKNVHQRIRLTFGEEYGLSIFSQPDKGTLVRITLPLISQEEAKKHSEGGFYVPQ